MTKTAAGCRRRVPASTLNALPLLALISWGTVALPSTAHADDCEEGYSYCGIDEHGLTLCTPDDKVCCAYVGRPDTYCEEGEYCTANGGCLPNCEAGYAACGTSCMPVGNMCCESVGHAELNCPEGTVCSPDGSCVDAGPGDEPGMTCPEGSKPCGQYCASIDNECCASVGRDDISCGAGSTCSPEGCVADRDSPTCPDGSSACGSYCAPNENECCDYVGRPEISCRAGSSCTATGCVSDEMPTDPNEDVCPDGTQVCGDFCSPSGSQCCASVGRPDLSCAQGQACSENGCVDLSGSGDGDLPEIPVPGGPGTTLEDGGFSCREEEAEGCTVKFCAKQDLSACYYSANGVHIECGSCADQAAIESCGRTAATECIEIPDLAAYLGCSATGVHADSNAWWLLLAFAGLLRRRSLRDCRARAR